MELTPQNLLKLLKAGEMAEIEDFRDSGQAFSLEGLTIDALHLSGVGLSDYNLSNTEWNACILENLHISASDLSGSFFNGCTFYGCTFENNVSEGMALDGCILTNTTLKNATLTECEWSNLQLKDSSLENVILDEIDWHSCTFTQCAFKGVSGTGTMRGIVLRSASIDHFDCSEVDVENCKAGNCDVIPAGFTTVNGVRKRVG